MRFRYNLLNKLKGDSSTIKGVTALNGAACK
jgi:hypothetical protein